MTVKNFAYNKTGRWRWVLYLLVLAFVVFSFFAMDRMISGWLNDPASESLSYKLYRLLEEQPDDSVFILGSSRSMYAINAGDFGVHAFNYSSENMGFEGVYFFLEEILKNNHTALVVIDVHHDFYMHDPGSNIDISSFIPLSGSEQRIRSFLLQNEVFRSRYQWPVLRYYGYYTGYFRHYTELHFTKTNRHYEKGGVIQDGKVQLNQLVRKGMLRENEEYVFQVDESKMNRLLNLFREYPEAVFLFSVSPYLKMSRDIFLNKTELDHHFISMQNDFPNVYYFDGYILDKEEERFKDMIHLNRDGNEAFTALLLDFVRTNKIIPDTQN